MPSIPLAKITANPDQPRKTFPKEHIEQLAASIAERGLIQPITVRKVGRDQFMIVAGECRFRAHQLLGRDTIEAMVADIDADEMMLQAIVENLQRHDMNAIEEANAFQYLLDRGMDAPTIVRQLGLRSTAIVHQRVLLLRLIPEIQQLVASGQLPTTMAGGIAHVPADRQVDIVRAVSSGRYKTAEQVKHACIALRDAADEPEMFDLPKPAPTDLAVLSRLEAKIADIVEMVVLGFKDGECVAAQRVAPDKVATMADQLALVRKHVLQMEHDLRRVATQGEIMLQLGNPNEKMPLDPSTVRVARNRGSQANRKQKQKHQLSRAVVRARTAENV